MASNRLVYLSLAASLAALMACGGGEEEFKIVGEHHTYVVSEAAVPANATQQREFGLDIGARTSSEPDGIVDNTLGNTFVMLKSLLNFDVQAALTPAVLGGRINLLVDIQATALTDATDAGMFVKLGANPNPAPCTDPTMIATCGQHLKGTGTFEIAANSPTDAVNGELVAGAFSETRAGAITLQIAVGAAPIALQLVSARVRATGVTDSGIQSIIVAGALLKTELNDVVLPGIHTELEAAIVAGCGATRTPPTCGCTGGLPATLLTVFDTNDDCTLGLDEFRGNAALGALLSADVCTKSSCDAPDALSAGLKVVAVKATFPTTD